jgi:predicted phosphoribosyltransferase
VLAARVTSYVIEKLAGDRLSPFRDREEAGKEVARALAEFRGKNVLVLGMPRGGVVVAKEVSEALGAPLDIVVTRKIGAPGEPEFALGAVTQEGDVIVDSRAVESVGATSEYLREEARKKKSEVLERMRSLRGDMSYPSLEGRTIIIVDDGMATGNSMKAAVQSVRKRGPKEVIVAVPVAPREAVAELSRDGTRVVCLERPHFFFAIGEFYKDFEQVEDSEVRQLLEDVWKRRGPNSATQVVPKETEEKIP